MRSRHPERVSHLVLHGGYARGRRKRGLAQEMEQEDALITLMRQGWGRGYPAFRDIFTSLFIPSGTSEQMKWFDDLQRVTTSPENAVRIRQANTDIDVDDLLPRLNVPTLVLHCRDDAVLLFEEGKKARRAHPRRAICRARRPKSPRSGRRTELEPAARRDRRVFPRPDARAHRRKPPFPVFFGEFVARFCTTFTNICTIAECSTGSISNPSFSLPSSPR